MFALVGAPLGAAAAATQRGGGARRPACQSTAVRVGVVRRQACRASTTAALAMHSSSSSNSPCGGWGAAGRIMGVSFSSRRRGGSGKAAGGGLRGGRGLSLRVAAKSSESADGWELAAAVMRLRRSQDECLDLILNEMSSLSKEVRSLREEVNELKSGGYVGGGSGGGASAEANDYRKMLDSLIPGDEEAPPAPAPAPWGPPKDEEVEVVINSASWRGDGKGLSRAYTQSSTCCLSLISAVL
jgi:hypothetical protein